MFRPSQHNQSSKRQYTGGSTSEEVRKHIQPIDRSQEMEKCETKHFAFLLCNRHTNIRATRASGSSTSKFPTFEEKIPS